METRDRPFYQSYLLRLWRERSGEGAVPVWRASLEDPHSGERQGFADLEALVAFLKAQVEKTEGR